GLPRRPGAARDAPGDRLSEWPYPAPHSSCPTPQLLPLRIPLRPGSSTGHAFRTHQTPQLLPLRIPLRPMALPLAMHSALMNGLISFSANPTPLRDQRQVPDDPGDTARPD